MNIIHNNNHHLCTHADVYKLFLILIYPLRQYTEYTYMLIIIIKIRLIYILCKFLLIIPFSSDLCIYALI